MIVGGGGWSAEAARRTCSRSRRRTTLPVGASFRCQDYVDNRSRVLRRATWASRADPKLAARVRDADLLLVVGVAARRVDDARATRCSRSRARARRSSTSTPTRRSSAASTSRRSRSSPAYAAVRGGAARRSSRSTRRPGRGWPSGARADYVANLRRAAGARRPRPGRGDGVPARAAARTTRSSPTAPATSPSGRTASTSSAATGTQLAPTSGAMGYGVPAAVAAKLVHPERIVVCFSGDGDFLMTRPGARDRRAVRAAAIVVLVVNNGMYGTIRMHQERHYPGRVVRHRPRQPGLRRLRARLRRARRGRRADGGLPGGVRARARPPAGRRCSSCASTPRRSRRGRR